tara:strand:- start:551 stop:754 length:204 start_codon:yes stop_codon:yes gene_type:complete
VYELQLIIKLNKTKETMKRELYKVMNEAKEQTQQDILTYLDGHSQEVLDEMCNIILRNFDELKSKTQ